MTEEAISVLQIYDQCILKRCENIGPVLSKEACSCVILPSGKNCEKLGKVILPGHEIAAPLCTTCTKIDAESFRITQIKVCSILPAAQKAGFWSADVVLSFAFSLQLLNAAGVPFQIVCCQDIPHDTEPAAERTWIEAGLSCRFSVTLFGGAEPPIKLFTTNGEECSSLRFLVNAEALPLKAWLKPSCCWGPYDEPCNYVYAAVGMIGTVQLARSTCQKVCSCKIMKLRQCDVCGHTPCEYFQKMEFPNEQFYPV